MGNSGLNKFDIAGAIAAIACVGLSLFGAICSYKGGVARNQQILNDSPLPPIGGSNPPASQQ